MDWWAPKAANELRADREIVLAAVRQNGSLLQLASQALREDRSGYGVFEMHKLVCIRVPIEWRPCPFPRAPPSAEHAETRMVSETGPYTLHRFRSRGKVVDTATSVYIPMEFLCKVREPIDIYTIIVL